MTRYHCLFCDGFEDRGSASAGVLAIGDIAKLPPALHLARMARRLAKRVVVYTNGASELSDQIAVALGQDPAIVLDNRRVARLEKVKDGSSETIVHLDDGTSASHGFVVSAPSPSCLLPPPSSTSRAAAANRVGRSTSQRVRSTAHLSNSSRWR